MNPFYGLVSYIQGSHYSVRISHKTLHFLGLSLILSSIQYLSRHISNSKIQQATRVFQELEKLSNHFCEEVEKENHASLNTILRNVDLFASNS